MATQTMAMCQDRKLHIEVLHVRLARTVAHFAGKGLVIEFRELLRLILVTFSAGRFARVNARKTRPFDQRVAAIPSVLTKGTGRQESAGDQVAANYADG